MTQVELSAGTIEYQDSGGDGPVLVFLHGVAMDGSVWAPVVADLGRDHRCVVPTLPLGAHRRPMRQDADLSLRGFGRIVAELLERLGLEEVTLIQNDHGAALALASDNPQPQRVAGLVISSCEGLENYPPGLPGKNLRLAAMMPGDLFVAMQAMRLPAVRRSPAGFGLMAKRPLPDGLVEGWLRQARTDPGVRHDLARYARGARRRQMLEVCGRLPAFGRPVLVIWTPEDRVKRPEHGRRLAGMLPDAQLIDIRDSYTLIMRDKPEAFANAVREFIRGTTGPRPGTANP